MPFLPLKQDASDRWVPDYDQLKPSRRKMVVRVVMPLAVLAALLLAGGAPGWCVPR